MIPDVYLELQRVAAQLLEQLDKLDKEPTPLRRELAYAARHQLAQVVNQLQAADAAPVRWHFLAGLDVRGADQ